MKRWFGIIFSILVIGFLIWFVKDVDFYELYLLLQYVQPFWFGLAVLSTFLTFIVWNIRWTFIVRPYLKGSFWFFLKVMFASAFFSTVTPGAGLSGEPLRAYFIAKKYKRPHAKVLGYVLGDSFFRLSALVIYTIFSVFFVLIYIKISGGLRLFLYIILASLLLASSWIIYLIFKKGNFKLGNLLRRFYYFKFVRKRFKEQGLFEEYINARMKSFTQIFRLVVKKKRNILVGLPLSFIFWGLNYLSAYFMFLSFGKEVNFLLIIIVFTLANIVGSFSPIPGGIGVSEGLMTFLYSAMGINFALALVVSLLQKMSYYFFSLFVGGWYIVRLRKTLDNG